MVIMLETARTSSSVNRLDRRRSAAERLLQWAEHLDPADRALVRSVYERGMPVSALARAAGVPPGRLRARLRRLQSRMTSPEFQLVLRRRDRWPRERRRVAELIFCRGWTQREAARALEITLHQVRRAVEQVKLLAREEVDRSSETITRRSSRCVR